MAVLSRVGWRTGVGGGGGGGGEADEDAGDPLLGPPPNPRSSTSLN